MKRSILVTTLIGVVAALALACYFGSPYWTLRQMADAAAANDTDRLATYVDFAALKDSFKNEVKAKAAQELMKGEADGLEAFGAAIGVAMADGMIDALVTPEMLRAMLASKAGGKSKLGSFDLAATDGEVVHDGLSQFRLRKADGDALVFQRRGLGWQLVAIRSAPERRNWPPNDVALESVPDDLTPQATNPGPADLQPAPDSDTKRIAGTSNERAVVGHCRVEHLGKLVIDGSCSGKEDASTVFVSAETGGCSVQIAKGPVPMNGELFGYKDTCWIDEDAEIAIDDDVDLGQFTLQNGCWVATSARLCLSADD